MKKLMKKLWQWFLSLFKRKRTYGLNTTTTATGLKIPHVKKRKPDWKNWKQPTGYQSYLTGLRRAKLRGAIILKKKNKFGLPLWQEKEYPIGIEN